MERENPLPLFRNQNPREEHPLPSPSSSNQIASLKRPTPSSERNITARDSRALPCSHLRMMGNNNKDERFEFSKQASTMPTIDYLDVEAMEIPTAHGNKEVYSNMDDGMNDDDVENGETTPLNLEPNFESQTRLEIGDGCRPFVRMEFSSIDDAYNFYNAYAREKGFEIRRQSSNSSKKPSGEIIAKMLVCKKKGKKYLKDKRDYGKEVERRRDTRVGCKVKLRLKLIMSKTWIVSVFIEEHNGHDPTSPNKVGKQRSHRQLHQTKRCKTLVQELDDQGLRPASISKAVDVVSGDKEKIITPNQVGQIIRTQRKNNMGQECLLIIRQFHDRSKLDPHFYFAMQVNNTETMRSVFWTDGRSRSSYLTFGDVVVFDVTYRTSKFSLPFAQFTSMNHHR